jgi:hypothetical protein
MPNASPIKTKSRQVRQQRIHGKGAKCRDCGETNPALLVLGSRPKRCLECKRRNEGRTLVEKHHPAGHANSAYTLPVPLNAHRALSELQQDWDQSTLRNITGCPLRAAAAVVRGFVETCREMLDRLIGWIPDLLEALSDWLHQELGDRWWLGSPLERWAPGNG